MPSIPQPNNKTATKALRALIVERQLLSALEVFHQELGNAFEISLPGFNATMLAGKNANHLVLVKARHRFRWRNEFDPVTQLLRHGLLVEDGESHDNLRHEISPSLHRTMLGNYVEVMWRETDRVLDEWQDNTQHDFLVEMRRIALLILMKTLFSVDIAPDMRGLWQPILKSIQFISPGLWMFWRNIPRPGYRHALTQLDDYLYRLVRSRRASTEKPEDLLSALIASGLSDDLIRDQLLTMLIAGHDTSTALLSWAFYLLTTHPEIMRRVYDEVDHVLGSEPPALQHMKGLVYTEQVIKETLRLYPPIHLGSRIAATDIEYDDVIIPAGSRVLYSIYLTHRDKNYWPDPHRFDPDRFAPENAQHSPYIYLPFGGGPRNCIGAAFAQVEAKVVVARILQRFAFKYVGGAVHAHMGATLEPHPGVLIQVCKRN